ncbi:MAG TPA: RDD family protein [Candidatus Onthocola stercoravium]|nr:RDD family protein [Candidatus Onthocola stercoravium]
MDIVLKRVMAYIIDVLIFSIVLTPIINWSVINPYVDEYTENYSEYTELVEQANAGEIDTETDEYKDKIVDLNYNINKYKVISSSISVVGFLLYFAVLQWALKGQTIGKKIMKIRVVANNEDKKLNVGNYILRSLILNNIIFSIILIIGVYIFKAPGYYTLSMVVSYLQLLVMSLIMLMVVLRKDYRGLHDFVAGTKVIDLAVPVQDETSLEKEEVEEKQVIEVKEYVKDEDEKKVSTNNKNKKKKSNNKGKSKKEKK